MKFRIGSVLTLIATMAYSNGAFANEHCHVNFTYSVVTINTGINCGSTAKNKVETFAKWTVFARKYGRKLSTSTRTGSFTKHVNLWSTTPLSHSCLAKVYTNNNLIRMHKGFCV